MDTIKSQEGWKEIELGIFSVLDNFSGSAYDQKAAMYEKLVSSKLYNKIIWGTSPDDYKEFGKKGIFSENGSLLDVGCGGLIQTAAIYSRTKRPCTLVDSSIEMLKIAKGRLIEQTGKLPDSIQLLQADAFNLPFAENCFDTVCSFGMIHLFDNKQEYVQELLRVLKVGGTFYFSTMITHRWISKLYIQQLRKLNEFGELCSEKEILALFKEEKSRIKSYRKGSMLFIEGEKIR